MIAALKSERIKETLHLIITPATHKAALCGMFHPAPGQTPDKHPYVGPRPERAALLLIHNASLVRLSARKSRTVHEREETKWVRDWFKHEAVQISE